MKEIIALLWAICIVVVAIYLHVNNILGKASTTVLFALAIVGGLGIANYDLVRKFKGLGLEVELETARKEIDSAKGKALSEIEEEVAGHKDSIAMLIRTGNELNEKLESQKTVVDAMIEKAESLETQLKDDQKKLEDMKGQVVLAHRNSQAIYNATKELSVILTRITYVQSQTKGEFGNTPRLQKAAEIIEKDIDRVLQLMIPDPQERNAFVKELTSALPSR
jgi:chromosome segregation ATPase